MRTQKRAPGHRPLAARRNALVLQDPRNRRSRDSMAEIPERALNPRITPARIVGRHADNQPPDLDLDARATRSSPSVGPFPCDQLAMPPENGIRRDDRCDLHENSTSQTLTEHSQTPPLVVTQPQPSAVQLPLQGPVLFTQEINDVALFLFEPAEQRCDKQV